MGRSLPVVYFPVLKAQSDKPEKVAWNISTRKKRGKGITAI